MKKKVLILKNHEDAKIPVAQHQGDVGLDITACEDLVIYQGSVGKVRTGLRIAGYENMENYFPKIEARSGLAGKLVFPVGCIVDQGYTGEIIIQLANLGVSPKFIVKKGDRIAQLVFYNIGHPMDIAFEEVDDVGETDRGDAGFGSTKGTQ